MKGFIKAVRLSSRDAVRLTVPKHLLPEDSRWVDMEEIDRSDKSGARRFRVRLWPEHPDEFTVDEDKVSKLFKSGPSGVAFYVPAEVARWASIDPGDIFYVISGESGSIVYIQQENKAEPSTLDTPERLAERFNLE